MNVAVEFSPSCCCVVVAAAYARVLFVAKVWDVPLMNRPELPDNVVAHTILVVLKKGDGEVTAYTTVLF